MTSLIKLNVLNRFSGDTQFTAEIDCDESASPRIKLGMAVKWADLRGADLSDAYLSGADLSDADLSDAPAIPALDSKIIAAIEAGGKLDMGEWHKCGTTHCRAGWAITLAGEAGAELEKKLGPAAAGALIYARSYPDLPIPNFYASNETAMADIRSRAATDEVAS